MFERNSFEILTEWSAADAAPSLERETAAELILKLGDHVLTRGFDLWSRTVTDRARISAYPMALWLASNWWRIRYEPLPDTRNSPSAHWRLAHDLSAAGFGYIWPAMRLAPDGEFMQVSAKAGGQAVWEPRHYQVRTPPVPVAMACFDTEIDRFLDLVIERLIATGADDSPLRVLWADVLAERNDPEVSAWRQMEARLGYDADQAPEWLMTQIDNLAQNSGVAAMAEIAPSIGAWSPEDRLRRITNLADAPGVPAKVEMTVASDEWPGKEPWTRGRALADSVRRHASLAAGPVDDEQLTSLLGMSMSDFAARADEPSPIGLGIRERGTSNLTLRFRRQSRSARRFEAARFLADQLTAPDDDRWLPQTDMATMRQKMQRAFAVEFLMPIDDLRDFLGSDVTVEAIDDASARYGISALAVSSHLINHGVIPARDALVD